MHTTLLKKSGAMKRQPLPDCHGGTGTLDWIDVIGGEELRGRSLSFIHDDIIPPGASIGVHRHDHEEYYYLLSGEGSMTLDGEVLPISAGDLAAVYPGGSHGIENTGALPMRLVVVGLR